MPRCGRSVGRCSLRLGYINNNNIINNTTCLLSFFHFAASRVGNALRVRTRTPKRLIRRHQRCGRPVVVGQHADSNAVVQHHVADFRDGFLFAEDHFARKSQRLVHGRRRGSAAGLVYCDDRGLPGLSGHQSLHRVHL